MFPLNLKLVTGGQSLCLLSKANSDVSWLWHRRLAHLNFKDLNKLVAMDLVRGMPALKFDNDSLCSACEHGKQTKQRHPTAEAISTACFTQNRSYLHKRFHITPYEVLNRRKPNVKFLHIFGCRCFILNLKDHLTKFNDKSEAGIFLGYSQDSKAYRVMNKRTRRIEETFNLTFDDYYIKKSLHPFPMSSIFPKPAVDVVPITTFDTDFTLLFDPPVRAVDSEARAPDNHVSELSKLTDGPDDSSTSSVQRPSSVEGEPSNRSEGNASVEGEPNNSPRGANSPTSPPQEISNIMYVYPTVQGSQRLPLQTQQHQSLRIELLLPEHQHLSRGRTL
ncbi:hypothetical protein L1887_39055 [Cichorium endivia]|nr:hypothetical protein L1887_39055 [Cichorium endivia]